MCDKVKQLFILRPSINQRTDNRQAKLTERSVKLSLTWISRRVWTLTTYSELFCEHKIVYEQHRRWLWWRSRRGTPLDLRRWSTCSSRTYHSLSSVIMCNSHLFDYETTIISPVFERKTDNSTCIFRYNAHFMIRDNEKWLNETTAEISESVSQIHKAFARRVAAHVGVKRSPLKA